MSRTLSTTQAAEYFGVHIKTIHRWIKSGKVPAEKIDGHWHLRVEAHDAPHQERNAQDNAHHLKEQLKRADSEVVHLREQIVHYREQIDHLTQLLAVQTKTNASLTNRLQAIEDMRWRSWWKRVFSR